MTHRKVKKRVVYVGYLCLMLLLVSVLAVVEFSLSGEADVPETNEYVNKTIFENDIPVVSTKDVIIRPYTDNSVKIVTNFYNSADEEETQKQSLIFFENTYLPSTGVSYQSDYDFDVVSILDGTVVTDKCFTEYHRILYCSVNNCSGADKTVGNMSSRIVFCRRKVIHL